MPVALIQYPDDIVHRNNNGGWHRNGKRAYRKAVQGILRFLQTAKEPRLYHLCFEPLDEALNQGSRVMTSRDMYKANMAMLHALVQMAEREGIKCEWWAAREIADSSKKDHLHAFMVIEAYDIKVAKLFNQFEDGRVQQHCKNHRIKFGIFEPKDYQSIHGRNTYMALPYQGPGNRQTALGGERLADALIWLSYLGKARSKPQDDSDGQIFPASRPARSRKAAQIVPSSPVDPSTGKGNHTFTEKEVQHDLDHHSKSPSGRASSSETNQSCGHDQGQSQSTGSSSSSSTLGFAGPRLRVPYPGSSTGTEAEAIRLECKDGGATGPEYDTRSPITYNPGNAMASAARYVASYLALLVDVEAYDRVAWRNGRVATSIHSCPARSSSLP